MSLSIEQLQQLLWSFRDVRAVFSALELDVFDNLGEGATAGEVAERIHANARATEMLLNAMASLEIVEKRGERFFNTDLSLRHLTGENRLAYLHQAKLWERWSTLTECVREGTAVMQRKRDEVGTRIFIAAMHRNAGERAKEVVAAVDASKSRKMLDLGGGSGAYSIAFAQANPELRATIIDHEPVLKIAAQHISEAGVGDRVSGRIGDMLSSDLESGFDLVLLSQVLHMFSESDCRAIVKRAYGALAEGGRIVIQEFILDPEKTSPKWAVLFSLNMLVGTSGGASYSAAEFGEWLSEAGFKNVRKVPLGQASLMVAEK